MVWLSYIPSKLDRLIHTEATSFPDSLKDSLMPLPADYERPGYFSVATTALSSSHGEDQA